MQSIQGIYSGQNPVHVFTSIYTDSRKFSCHIFTVYNIITSKQFSRKIFVILGKTKFFNNKIFMNYGNFFYLLTLILTTAFIVIYQFVQIHLTEKMKHSCAKPSAHCTSCCKPS